MNKFKDKWKSFAMKHTRIDKKKEREIETLR